MDLISYKQFQTLVNHHDGDHKVKGFSCWKQFLCMAFGQLTHRERLSDTMLCLKANAGKLYHLGIGELVAKSTLSKAMKIAPILSTKSLQCYLFVKPGNSI